MYSGHDATIPGFNQKSKTISQLHFVRVLTALASEYNKSDNSLTGIWYSFMRHKYKMSYVVTSSLPRHDQVFLLSSFLLSGFLRQHSYKLDMMFIRLHTTGWRVPVLLFYLVTRIIISKQKEWMVFQATILHCKVILGRGQPRPMSWVMIWIMPQVQDRSLDLLTWSPARFHCTTVASPHYISFTCIKLINEKK